MGGYGSLKFTGSVAYRQTAYNFLLVIVVYETGLLSYSEAFVKNHEILRSHV